MKKETTRGRLRIHRETLRTLSDARLARVAGGTLLVVNIEVLAKDSLDGPNPRSNGWTGEGETLQPTC